MSSHGDSADHEQSGSPIDICQWIGFCNPTKNTPALQPPKKNKQAGVGVILSLNPDNSIFIHTVCPNSSSDGYLRKGDILVGVGNQNVTGKSASSVAHLLLGPEGSEVSITVLRNQDETTDQPQQLKFHLKRQRTDTAAARIAVKNAINERLEPFR
uniref:PDZ domain-containing protein n=1 Tax=Hanusia phi TaxID=3032 RepID=A0A7S0I3Q1_9CRYP|mmetsp:Transcript_9245/g.21152  ORF Transcript_9245/g.21152 Transcript_9245/m.21152 type:complete len:156 (+) Transcript_9245:168-635(+)